MKYDTNIQMRKTKAITTKNELLYKRVTFILFVTGSRYFANTRGITQQGLLQQAPPQSLAPNPIPPLQHHQAPISCGFQSITQHAPSPMPTLNGNRLTS